MVRAWIIDKLIEEQRKKEKDDRPVLQLPIDEMPLDPPNKEDERDSQRGVLIIDNGEEDDQ